MLPDKLSFSSSASATESYKHTHAYITVPCIEGYKKATLDGGSSLYYKTGKVQKETAIVSGTIIYIEEDTAFILLHSYTAYSSSRCSVTLSK